MKFWYKFILLPVIILVLTGCEKDSSDEDEKTVVDEESSGVYHSKDMSEDGKVTQLQKHTEGNGIPIVIMCDRFQDRDITNGNYRKATNWALEGLFSVHPMKSLRKYFDVYEVTAVSYDDYPSDSTRTAFNIPPVGYVGYTSKYEEYTTKAIAGDRIDDAVTIILVPFKPEVSALRSYCIFELSQFSESDIPTGRAVAHVNFSFDKNAEVMSHNNPPGILLHEAIGHGFAKLADEYIEKTKEFRKWDNYDSDKKYLTDMQKRGYYRNVSIDSDITKSYWADFAADSRYDFEKLGCYEGGYYQEKGVYRATENSIMKHTYDHIEVFNVIGRMMIYKRCMRLAYGDRWTFDYEDFVNFDLEKAKAEIEEIHRLYPLFATSKSLGAPPVIVNKTTK